MLGRGKKRIEIITKQGKYDGPSKIGTRKRKELFLSWRTQEQLHWETSIWGRLWRTEQDRSIHRQPVDDLHGIGVFLGWRGSRAFFLWSLPYQNGLEMALYHSGTYPCKADSSGPPALIRRTWWGRQQWEQRKAQPAMWTPLELAWLLAHICRSSYCRWQLTPFVAGM